MLHHVRVQPIPRWVDAERLLGPGEWGLDRFSGPIIAEARLDTETAADLAARLRNVGVGGAMLEVTVKPTLKRRKMRDALTREARRRRDTSPGFRRHGTRLDLEGRLSLTPERLALDIGERFGGCSVVDAGCGAGGNAIGFARSGCRVVAVDSDEKRIEMARQNAAVYHVEDKIHFVCADAVDEVAARSADVLFADPPWGPDWSRERTEAADLPLIGRLIEVFERGGYGTFVLKVPPSFDPATVPGARAEAMFGRAAGDYRRVKFVLLTLTRPA